MRFVRNIALKEHLDQHFELNLALKRRGTRTVTRDQFQGFHEFITARQNKIKQDGGSKGGAGVRNSDELVAYEGSKSNEPMYNFCYLCKERLETVHDEGDECWYFVNTK